LTAVGGTDPDWDGSSCSGNHIDLTKTEWEPSSGTCDPSTGASSNWKPSERGNFQVRAKFEDMTGSGECDEEGQWTSFMQIINAFEIKVSMQVIDNAEGGNGTVTKELWEYATGEQAVSWQSLPCSSNRIKWNNTLINIPPLRQEDEDNVHIDFVYTPVPENAVLSGGWIVAKLKTYSSATLICRVEDADAFEEPVTIDVGITVGNPVGFNIGTTFTFGSNCAEGSAVAAWGYNSTDGLGSSHSPGNYKLVKTSNQFIDEELFMCADLDGNALSLANLHLKVSESPVVYDTNWVLIKKSSNGTVQAEWTGYSCAEVGGIDWPFGKYSSSSLGEWNVWVGIKEVGYEE